MSKKIFAALTGALLTIILSCCVSAHAQEYELTLLQEGGFPHPYYSENEPDGLRDEIKTALASREESIEISALNLSAEELSGVYEDVINHAPKLSYVLGSVNIEETADGYRIYPRYREDVNLMSASDDRIIQQAVDDIIAQVKPGMSDVEKILAVHDYMVLNYEYDLEYEIYYADEFFLNKRGVCQAYALAFGEIMDEIGIKWDFVTSDPMNHAWNVVQLDGKWYHVDVTWDDPISDTYGRVMHSYLLLSDSAISDDYHRHYDWIIDWGAGSYITADSSKYDNYFWKDVRTQIQYYNGALYWVQQWSFDGCTRGINKYNNSSGEVECIYPHEELVDMRIYNGYIYFVSSNIDGKTEERVYSIYMSPLSKPKEAVLIAEKRAIKNLNGVYMGDGIFSYAVTDSRYYEDIPGYYRYRTIESVDLRGFKYSDVAPSWRFDEETGVLSVSVKSGIIPDYLYIEPPWKEYADRATELRISNGIKEIGSGAFLGMTAIERVSLPDTLEKIGANAFKMCTGIKMLTIPDLVTTIDDGAFFGCRDMVLLFLGSGVTNIGISAFETCWNLGEVYYPGDEQMFGNINISDTNYPLAAADIIYGYMPPMLMHMFNLQNETVVLWLFDNKAAVGEKFDYALKQYSYNGPGSYQNARYDFSSDSVNMRNGDITALGTGKTHVTVTVGEEEVSFDLYSGIGNHVDMTAYFGYGVTPFVASYSSDGAMIECKILDPETINETGFDYIDYGGESRFMAWGDISGSMYPAGRPVSLSPEITVMSYETE